MLLEEELRSKVSPVQAARQGDREEQCCRQQPTAERTQTHTLARDMKVLLLLSF